MSQLNRVNLENDIVTNIYTNVTNDISGNDVQARMKNIADSAPNILTDANQANGYVATSSDNEINQEYVIEQISYANLVTKAAANGLNLLKQYYIDDAASGDRLLVVRAATVSSLFQQAIDLATGEVGTYDLGTDTFIGGAGTYTPTLTPDGSVITAVSQIHGYQSTNGTIVTFTFDAKLAVDFTMGDTGDISIDTLPFPAGTPYLIGPVSISFSTAPAGVFSAFLQSHGNIRVYCADISYTSTQLLISVTAQYEIN